ncbi:Hpt domain-containing protein [Pseudoduganella lutea]|uniref:Hpt domain-containing protein n=1 Tax=Pseudoduganella lutea TaxID=321985 RepID=A0A4P6L0C0_9BURK|nr:Hpt domain-containing protein [Pseudoduganella lutea]QBE64048.1 Hpt domain-containing protein [Pseudoduganella lutea]
MNIPVLDVEAGIARLLGNSTIYFSALKRFTVHLGAARAVTAQIAAGDHAGACRTVHTLRGAAGLLGAGEVQAIAMEVEKALASGSTVHALLGDLEAALQRVQACIDVTVPKEVATPIKPVQANAMRDVQELLDHLGALLDEGNGMAIDIMDKYEIVLEKALGAAAWHTILAAGRDYDFDRALVALQGARSTARR